MSIAVSAQSDLPRRRAKSRLRAGPTPSVAPSVSNAGILGVAATMRAGERGCRSEPGDYTSLRLAPLLSSGIAVAPYGTPVAAHLNGTHR